MRLNDYQKLAKRTAAYPVVGHAIGYPTWKLCGEAGEFSELVGKMFRDDGGVLTDERRHKMILELGDVLWYVANIAADLNVSLSFVADLNIDKLARRVQEGTIKGEGSDR